MDDLSNMADEHTTRFGTLTTTLDGAVAAHLNAPHVWDSLLGIIASVDDAIQDIQSTDHLQVTLDPANREVGPPMSFSFSTSSIDIPTSPDTPHAPTITFPPITNASSLLEWGKDRVDGSARSSGGNLSVRESPMSNRFALTGPSAIRVTNTLMSEWDPTVKHVSEVPHSLSCITGEFALTPGYHSHQEEPVLQGYESLVRRSLGVFVSILLYHIKEHMDDLSPDMFANFEASRWTHTLSEEGADDKVEFVDTADVRDDGVMEAMKSLFPDRQIMDGWFSLDGTNFVVVPMFDDKSCRLHLSVLLLFGVVDTKATETAQDDAMAASSAEGDASVAASPTVVAHTLVDLVSVTSPTNEASLVHLPANVEPGSSPHTIGVASPARILRNELNRLKTEATSERWESCSRTNLYTGVLMDMVPRMLRMLRSIYEQGDDRDAGFLRWLHGLRMGHLAFHRASQSVLHDQAKDDGGIGVHQDGYPLVDTVAKYLLLCCRGDDDPGLCSWIPDVVKRYVELTMSLAEEDGSSTGLARFQDIEHEVARGLLALQGLRSDDVSDEVLSQVFLLHARHDFNIKTSGPEIALIV